MELLQKALFNLPRTAAAATAADERVAGGKTESGKVVSNRFFKLIWELATLFGTVMRVN